MSSTPRPFRKPESNPSFPHLEAQILAHGSHRSIKLCGQSRITRRDRRTRHARDELALARTMRRIDDDRQMAQALDDRDRTEIGREAQRRLCAAIVDSLSITNLKLRNHRSSGLLNISLLNSFLQKWLLPRLTDFYQQHPEIDLRFNASRSLVDFAQTDFHAAVRYGNGKWPDLRAEHVMDEWVFPVASPALAAQHGAVRTVGELQKYRLLNSAHEPWSDWLRRLGGDTTRLEQGPMLEDSISVLNAAERGEGLALARWSLVADDLAVGRLVRVGTQSVRQRAAYYLVAPPEHFALPKLQRFHAWLSSCCQQFLPPEGERLEPT